VLFRGFGLSLLSLVFLPTLVLGVIALVDSTRRSDAEWARAGQNKTLWVVLIAVGLVTCMIGIVIELVYLLSIRPQLDRVAAGADPATVVSGSPQSGWYPDPYARHELRYFDGMQWSENVSNGGVPGIDPAR
jgi:hypothetical protein